MALITTLETDNGYAIVRQDGAELSWTAYLYETESDIDKKNYYKLGRGFDTPIEALEWSKGILNQK